MKRSRQQVAVILNQDTDNVGFAGELVIAKPGFVRNFLLRGDRADIATPERRKKRETEIAKASERREAEAKKLGELAQTLSAEVLQAQLNMGVGNQVFGSITAGDVCRLLKEKHDVTVKTSAVAGVPVKSLGSHMVSVKLGIGVTAEVPLKVSGKKAKADAPEESPSDPDQE